MPSKSERTAEPVGSLTISGCVLRRSRRQIGEGPSAVSVIRYKILVDDEIYEVDDFRVDVEPAHIAGQVSWPVQVRAYNMRSGGARVGLRVVGGSSDNEF